MGVVQRQVFKNNIIAIAAVLVGAVSNIFIYPLDFETKGFADAILKWARLFMPFFVLGVGSVMVKYRSYVADGGEEAARRLFTRALGVVTAALTTTAALLLIFGADSLQWVNANVLPLGLMAYYPWTVFFLLAGFCYTLVLMTNLVNYQRIAVPVIFNSLLPKIGLPLLILAGVYWGMTRPAFTTNLVLLYGGTVIGLYGYTLYLGKHRLSTAPLGLPPDRRREMYALAGFSILGSIGSTLSTQLDTIFVNTYLGNVPTGIYSFAVFASTVMAIPSQAVNSIAGPIVSAAWKEGDIDQIAFLYRESASVLFAAGGLILVGGALCLPQVFLLSANPAQTSLALVAFLFLGAGQLVDLLTSINGMIISYSSYFRWNMFFVIFLGVINLAMNYIFIARFGMGINGAAVATFLSLVLYNLIKVAFVWWKIGILPFSRSIAYTSLALVITWAAVNWVPLTQLPWLDLLIRGGLACGLFLAYLWFTDGVPQVRGFLRKGTSLLSDRLR